VFWVGVEAYALGHSYTEPGRRFPGPDPGITMSTTDTITLPDGHRVRRGAVPRICWLSAPHTDRAGCPAWAMHETPSTQPNRRGGAP